NLKSLIYRDWKPENLLLGPPDSSKWYIVHLVDLGTCKRFIDPTTHEHIPRESNLTPVGTRRYISSRDHQGFRSSRRDELESVTYVLIYLATNYLPWLKVENANYVPQHDTKDNDAKYLKAETPIEEICKGMPDMFKMLLTEA